MSSPSVTLSSLMLKMLGLERLHSGMKAVSMQRVRFRIEHNHLVFEGVFLTDLRPYELALACLEHDFVLFFTVNQNYEISAYLGDKYSLLAKALGTGAGSGNKLISSDFLREIDAKLPHRVGNADRAERVDVVRVYRDVEESEKVYFVRFIPHDKEGRRHVTIGNLEKTRRLMGQDTYDWCRINNVSTGWTDVRPHTAASEELPV